MATTKQEVRAVIEVVLAVGDAIRELGRVPSGHLYARLSGMMNLDSYNAIIDTLKRGGVVREENHELIWIGGGTQQR